MTSIGDLIEKIPKLRGMYNLIRLRRLHHDIIKTLRKKKNINNEEEEVLHYLEKNKIGIFPYDFVRKYQPQQIQVFNNEGGLPYVLHQKKKLYFKKSMSKEAVQELYCSLLIEQDANSPHRYLSDKIKIENEVIADIGAAEGIFSLDVIDYARKVIIFEGEPEWILPLKMTFYPWNGKTEIVQKFVGDNNDDQHVKLDSFIEEGINLVKMDVEGSEMQVLKSGQKTLESPNLHTVIACTYHNQNDSVEIGNFLHENGYDTYFSKGYMILHYDRRLSEPYLRHGLIIGTKGGVPKKGA